MERKSEVSLEEVFDYLEALRQSGAINMFGAAPYIEEAFAVSRYEAKDLLLKWMDSKRLPSFPDGH